MQKDAGPHHSPDRERLRELIVELAVVHGRVTLSSGREADWYIDMRRLTLHHEGAPLVGRVMRQLTRDLRYDVVGGLTVGADPVATAMLHAAADGEGFLDACVVRKAGKAHGLQRRIEGPDVEGRAVLVVEVSSTASTRRPATSGPSIRRCSPCALPSLRTTNASSLRPCAAAACSIAVATGSAPRVRPPTASKSRSAASSNITDPTSGAALDDSVTRRRST